MSISDSQITVSWFFVTVSTALFYTMLNVCHYLIDYHLLFVPLCPLHSSVVCPMSIMTSHSTVSWFCVIVSTAVFYSLSTVCQYLTLYCLLLLCHYVHCYLLHYVHYQPVRHIVPYVSSVSLCPQLSSTFLHCLPIGHTLSSLGSVSLCPLMCSTVRPIPVSTSHSTVCPLSVSTSHSTICPLSVSTSHCNFSWFCVTISTAVFYRLYTVCQYYFLSLTRLLITLLQ